MARRAFGFRVVRRGALSSRAGSPSLPSARRMPLRVTGAAGCGTILKSTSSGHAPNDFVRAGECGASGEDKLERRGVDCR
jgi:hypothetical protein